MLKFAGKANRVRHLLSLALILLFLPQVYGTHIIGGELTYTALGNYNYTITLKVYRDCFHGVPPFDNPAAIGVFDSTNQLLADVLIAFPGSVKLKPELSNPCLTIPPDICVEEAVYQVNIHLPPLKGGYQLAYQRCCRNHSINNIIDPASTGATYYIQVKDTGTVKTNSSPYFNHFPPILICQNEPLIFDHSATDPDGDSLVYSLCQPFDGADTLNPRPQPPYSPPYPLVSWKAPYSTMDPLGGKPLQIDPVSGLLTGTPSTLGQFVVGICVQEYRKGILLSTNKRDFQFNVRYCPPLPGVSVSSTQNHCGNDPIQFFAQSKNAINYNWDFGVPGSATDTSSLPNPVFVFPDFGTYQVNLIVNKGYRCADTAITQLNLNRIPKADFSHTSSCSGLYSFQDLSSVASDHIDRYDWRFGDSGFSSQQNPVQTFTFDSTYSVSLKVTTDKGCQDSVNKNVVVYPLPHAAIIASSMGCAPLLAKFNSIDTKDKEAIYTWDWGDGTSATGASVTHLYKNPGKYKVKLQLVSSQGCPATPYLNEVNVFAPPTSKFLSNPKNTTIDFPDIHFKDLSVGAAKWFWDFGDNKALDSIQNPVHTFTDTGYYRIHQRIVNQYGCSDTSSALVHIRPIFSFYVPNAMSLNGLNQHFYGYGIGIKDYELLIFNRWGEKIFETHYLTEGWDATLNGRPVEQGVYIYLIHLKDVFKRQHQYYGTVTVIN